MILFVDDEKRRMDSYVQELQLSGYEVEFKSDIDSALEFFTRNQAKIELIILDIMMSTGESFDDKQTEYGLRTGVAFYKRIREQNPVLPIIVFTNVSDESLSRVISIDRKALFCEKESFITPEFREVVKKTLEENNLQTEKK